MSEKDDALSKLNLDQLDDEYVPSAADAPDGPRNNRDELDEIAARGQEFEARREGIEIVDEDNDPFSKNNAPAFILVTAMRIYDVQMELLRTTNPGAYKDIREMHERGDLNQPFPWLNVGDDDEVSG